MRGIQACMLVIILMISLYSLPSSAQDVNYSVEVDCEEKKIELEADPNNIVGDNFECTFTNPSIHQEKIRYFVVMNSGTEVSPKSGEMVLDGGTSETIEFDIMAVGVRSDTYRYDVIADVVEVWGAPPPDGYKRDIGSGNYTILPYYDFELDVCNAGFSYYSDSRISLSCWVINLGNAEDKFDMTISQDSKDALIDYGFKFNPQVSSSNDLIFGYTLVSVEGVFIFDGDTSKWSDNDTQYSLSEVVMVEIHSRGAVDKGKPVTKQASVPIEISIEKEIDGIQIGSGESLIASGIIESLVIVMLAFAFVRRETQYIGKSLDD